MRRFGFALFMMTTACFLTVARADMKGTSRMTVSGHNMDQTVYVKGARQRNEMNMAPGFSMVNIYQCDLKRTVQINDRTRTYYVMQVADESPSAAEPVASPHEAKRRGGVVTVTSNIADTGERQKMFGYTARHLKSQISIESSPDSCDKNNSSISTDGWYIDASPALSCATHAASMRPPAQTGGCQDRYKIRSTGSGKLGFPVKLTTTINSNPPSSFKQETIELSSATLPNTLFEVPAGYREVHSMQELMGLPQNLGEMMKGNAGAPLSEGEEGGSAARQNDTAQVPGMLRIGIAPVNNATDSSFSAEAVREKMIDLFHGMNSEMVDAVPLNASQYDAQEREAHERGCKYLLVTEVSSVKEPSTGRKVGGFLGRAAGVETENGVYESTLAFKLYRVGDPKTHLSSRAISREGSDAEASVSSATEQEVSAVMEQIRREK